MADLTFGVLIKPLPYKILTTWAHKVATAKEMVSFSVAKNRDNSLMVSSHE